MGIKEYNQTNPKIKTKKNKKIPYKPKTNQRNSTKHHTYTHQKTKQKTPRTTSISHLKYNQ